MSITAESLFRLGERRCAVGCLRITSVPGTDCASEPAVRSGSVCFSVFSILSFYYDYVGDNCLIWCCFLMFCIMVSLCVLCVIVFWKTVLVRTPGRSRFVSLLVCEFQVAWTGEFLVMACFHL